MSGRGMLALLKYPEFLKLWLARTVSRFGDSVDSIAFMWMIYQLTGSGAQMGLIMAVNFLPNLIFGMFGGVIADRKSKKATMLVGDIGRGAIVSVTALFLGMGILKAWHLYIFTFLNSTLEAFAAPARTSSMPLLVEDKADILAANSLFSASGSLAEIVGLGVAGTIIGYFGVAAAMLVDAATFFASALSISLTRIPQSGGQARSRMSWRDLRRDLGEGVSLAFGNRLIRLCIFMGFALNAFASPFSILAPLFSDQVLQAGAQGFGNMNMALASAMMIGSLMIGQFGRRFSDRQRITAGFLGMGLGFLLVGVSHSIWLAVTGSVCIGLGVSFLISTMTTIVMTRCQPELLGRVTAVMNGAMMSAMPASTALAGAIVQPLGTVRLITAIGIVVLLIGALTASSPHLRPTEKAGITTNAA